jgi:arginine/serine-rich splicing factor 7
MVRGGTQLFVGRLSKETKQRDLENVFYLYGKLSRCDIKYGELIFEFFGVLFFA